MAAQSALQEAHSFAVEADEHASEARFERAAACLTAAAERYCAATLDDAPDVDSLHALRLLAVSHSQRAHEMRCRIALHAAHVNRQVSNAESLGASGLPPPSDAQAADAPAHDDGAVADAATSSLVFRACAYLRPILEALHFGAEELSNAGHLQAPAPPASPTVGNSMGFGSGLERGPNDSVCLAPGSRLSIQADSGLGAENALLRQRNNELFTALATERTAVQRRAKEQIRLSRKALRALKELSVTSRTDVPGVVEEELASLRRQLDDNFEERCSMAEQLRKYERRWEHLKASARRKQMLKDAAEAREGLGSAGVKAER